MVKLTGTKVDGRMVIEGRFLRETAKAVLVDPGFESSVWIPKSQLRDYVRFEEDLRDGMPPMQFFSATIPVWLWNKMPIKTGPVPYATRPW